MNPTTRAVDYQCASILFELVCPKQCMAPADPSLAPQCAEWVSRIRQVAGGDPNRMLVAARMVVHYAQHPLSAHCTIQEILNYAGMMTEHLHNAVHAGAQPPQAARPAPPPPAYAPSAGFAPMGPSVPMGFAAPPPPAPAYVPPFQPPATSPHTASAVPQPVSPPPVELKPVFVNPAATAAVPPGVPEGGAE